MDDYRLVVVNENTLGYIQDETPDYLCILHASILRGSRFQNLNGPMSLSKKDVIRDATLKDFDNFNVSSKYYNLKK